jgi:hypothetical protein
MRSPSAVPGCILQFTPSQTDLPHLYKEGERASHSSSFNPFKLQVHKNKERYKSSSREAELPLISLASS